MASLPFTLDPAHAEAAGAAVAADWIGRQPDSAGRPTRVRPGRPTLDEDIGCPCGCGELELLVKARAGDADAAEELLHRYRVLARTKAQSYFLLGGDREDLVQEGMLGLYTAIKDYDQDRGVRFRTFAEVCVTRQIITAVRAGSRRKHAPLNDSLSLDAAAEAEQAGPRLADLFPAPASADPAVSVVSSEQMRALQRHFDEVLSDLERQVLRHHVDGKDYDEIAGMLQRHVKSVDNALQRVKSKLRTHLSARDSAV